MDLCPMFNLKLKIMGVLKLSVIEDRNKKMRKKLHVISKEGKSIRISACSCPCECFIKKGDIINDIGQDASWNID